MSGPLAMFQSHPSTSSDYSRRDLLRTGGLGLLGALTAASLGQSLAAAAPQDAGGAKDPTPAAATGLLQRLHRYPRCLQEYYVRRVREVERRGQERRAALRTKEDAEKYVADVRESIREAFGPLPEKTPLNAMVTAVHERDGYRIENVIFESRPRFPVTANLYVPTGRQGPMPGVVGTCGHSATGKAGGTYQAFAQALARQGYVTLIYDPIGQGERLQHVGGKLQPLHGIGVSEHTYLGNQMTLVGENLPLWFAWDGIRALDYLLTRAEVDPKHLGVTGNSGGGTQTACLCALERRFTMAAPGCFITTWRRNIENEHPSDPEQYPWKALALGLDHSDFMAAMAPNPVILLGQEKDYFDARGFEEAADRLRQLYALLGAEQNFAAFLGTDYHGYSQPMREAMYGWFNRQTGVAAEKREPQLVTEPLRALQCTTRGQVAESNPAAIFTTVRDASVRLRQSRPTLHAEALKAALTGNLRIPPLVGVAEYRKLEPSHGRRALNRSVAHYAVETEESIIVVLYRLSKTKLLSRIPKETGRALLYIAHDSADQELREDRWLRSVVAEEPNTVVFACDVRGVGESRPLLSTIETKTKGAENFHSGLGLMFDAPLPGRRTFDVLRVLDLLAACGHQQFHLVAQGFGAIPGTFAAVLHDKVDRVTLKHPLTSYADVAEAAEYNWPSSALPPGILQSLRFARLLSRTRAKAAATGRARVGPRHCRVKSIHAELQSSGRRESVTCRPWSRPEEAVGRCVHPCRLVTP